MRGYSSVSNCLLCKYEDLSSIPRIYVKNNLSTVVHAYNGRASEVAPRGYKELTGSLAYMMRSRPVSS